MNDSTSSRTYTPYALVVALAAGLWGLDALFRRPLAIQMSSSTLVFAEHVILVALLSPFIFSALKAARQFDVKSWIYLLFIGAGASAGATILFTNAFMTGDAITPVMLQKLQPAIVVIGASILLKEKISWRYVVYFVSALVAAWLIAFPRPFDVTWPTLKPALLSVAAATLWAMGTVLGRHLTGRTTFVQLTTLRFAVGLPAAALFVLLDGATFTVPSENWGRVLALTIVTGLVAMLLYYYGLQRTPAHVATIAELAFPVTAVLVGYLRYDEKLDGSQWFGVIGLCVVITALSLYRQERKDSSLSPEVAP